MFGKVKGTNKGQLMHPEAAQVRVAIGDVADYIVNFYNAVRLNSKLGNLSPNAIEHQSATPPTH